MNRQNNMKDPKMENSIYKDLALIQSKKKKKTVLFHSSNLVKRKLNKESLICVPSTKFEYYQQQKFN